MPPRPSASGAPAVYKEGPKEGPRGTALFVATYANLSTADEVVVKLHRRAHLPTLLASGLLDMPISG